MDIEDKIDTILEVRKVLTKKNLMLQLENKCDNLQNMVHRFQKKFNVLYQKGLPRLQGMGDELIQLEDYQRKLCDISRDRSKF